MQDEILRALLDGDPVVGRGGPPVLPVEGLVALGRVIDLGGRRGGRRRRLPLARSGRQDDGAEKREGGESQVPGTSL
jgi:hypothetical protein